MQVSMMKAQALNVVDRLFYLVFQLDLVLHWQLEKRVKHS